MSDQSWRYVQRWEMQYGAISVQKDSAVGYLWSAVYNLRGISGIAKTLSAAKRRALAEYEKLRRNYE